MQIWPQPSLNSLRVPVAAPELTEDDYSAVFEALRGGQISGSSPLLNEVELKLESLVGSPSLLVSNGSVALMLALRALKIGHGDEVVVPTFTYAATASSVVNVGAEPVFVDSNPADWNLDVDDFSRAITPKTRAVILVDVYGITRDWSPIVDLARSLGIAIVHDCAESLGATYNGRPTGQLADVRTYSFFANKLITSGEGGAVATDDPVLFHRMKSYRGQGMSPTFRYWFEEPGYNFRLSSIQAALLSGQLERFGMILERRKQLFDRYDDATAHFGERPKADSITEFAPWMYTIKLEDLKPTELAEHLAGLGVETRPAFYPLHEMPAFKKFARNNHFPVAEEISRKSVSLPTHSNMTPDDLAIVLSAIRSFR